MVCFHSMDHHEDSSWGPPWTKKSNRRSGSHVATARRHLSWWPPGRWDTARKCRGLRGAWGAWPSGPGEAVTTVGLVFRLDFGPKIQGFWHQKAWNTCETMGILMQNLTMQNMGWSHEQMGISPEIQAETMQNYVGSALEWHYVRVA
jgi:hypothetical protein